MTGATTGLIDALDALPGRKFAVVDAAHFDDLPAELEAAGFAGRPLYLDEQKDDVVAAGPFLVSLPDRNAGRRLAELIGDKPAVVWWSWPDRGEETEEAVFRHLRTINMVEIPAGPDDPDDPAVAAEARAREAATEQAHDHDGHDHGDQPPEPHRFDLVLFRHADPHALAMLLPELDAIQFARLFGDATGIVINAPDLGGLRMAPRPPDLPPAPGGPLRIYPEQYASLSRARAALVESRVGAFLRRMAPAQAGELTEAQLRWHVAKCMNESLGYGVTSEGSHCRWAYLQLLARGRLSQIPEINNMFRVPDHAYDANLRMRYLMEGLAEQVGGVA
ncbi:MAG: DUF4123 domain-containing protein [Phyllobacteriaceae bacterium]|nr:DUF4123 domain-containing protein [Phyllobacteriaceae bacterium]